MSNVIYPRIEDEKVVCALLEAGNVQYFSILGGFTSTLSAAWLTRKADLFDKVCEEPNFDEICGRIVFLNEKELLEIVADNEAEKYVESIRQSA